ncbi:MAG TPA: Swt1 family HEPN domain-containing protein [bacterium]|jgi:hypothetical protein
MNRTLSTTERLKLFGVTHQLIDNELSKVESDLGVDLGRTAPRLAEIDSTYYPQFEQALRKEASSMAEHYEVFYCLENTIRQLVCDTMEGVHGADWWNSDKVPSKLRDDVAMRMQRERDSGVTRRSNEPLDYTNFGELSEIIKVNWDAFGSILNSQKAVEKVMSALNTLRGPIAHCCTLAEDEALRLRLSVRDWFRLME